MKIAETIYTPFKKGQFWPVLTVLQFSEFLSHKKNSWSQVNNWKKIIPAANNHIVQHFTNIVATVRLLFLLKFMVMFVQDNVILRDINIVVFFYWMFFLCVLARKFRFFLERQ